MDADGSASSGGRLPAEIQSGETTQPAGLRKSGGVCSTELSIPSSGRASPSLRWEWTKKQRNHKLKPMLGLTNQWSRKVNPLTSNDNPAGRLQLGVLMAVAELERGIIKERVNAGLRAAKARGVQLGRPSTLNGRAREIKKLKARGLGPRAIARELKMPPSSVHKALSMAA